MKNNAASPNETQAHNQKHLKQKVHAENNLKKHVLAYCVLFVTLTAVTVVRYVLIPSQYGHAGLRLIFTTICLLAICLVYAICTILISKRLNKFKFDSSKVMTLCFVIIFSYTISIFISAISPFLMPTFLTAFILAPLFDRKDVFLTNLLTNTLLLTTVLLNPLIGDQYPYLYQIHIPVIMFVAGTLFGTIITFLLVGEVRRFNYTIKGFAIALGGVVFALLLGLLAYYVVGSNDEGTVSILNWFLFLLAAFVSQLMFSIVLQPLLERIFNLITNSRLIDLIDHNFPLIKRLIQEAPGTFAHSQNVANFAELCALSIGENPYMARACAHYHDIGKLENSNFFKENQADTNPHDDILPEVSAEIIKSHTKAGQHLCQEYKLPKKIAQVAAQHHGTTAIMVFLHKARELNDANIEQENFYYDGDTPTSKIAAIIMICDAAEAAFRAAGVSTIDGAKPILDGLVWDRLKSGQFDNCNITLDELTQIKQTILSIIGGIYHKRLKYLN
ncbi:MAG: HDIG domain-containing protein [Firmicutes bacterium]|nr:HDIG domain-containing protein [Bacillota bacterium]